MDIGSAGVKLVELGRSRAGQLVLERCASEPLGPHCMSDGHIEDFDAVAAAMRRVLRRSGTRTRQVAMSLPSSAVITKKITLPGGLSESELEVQVETEAGQYIPFSLDEVSLDFCVVGPSPASPDHIDVLIVASRKDQVQDRQGLAEAAGLRPVILDVDSYASRRAAARLIDSLPRAAPDAVVALFEVGATSTRLQVLRAGEVLYEREQAFGDAALTQKVARSYGLDAQEAERRMQEGDLPPDCLDQILSPWVQGLAHDMARALEFFFASTPHHRVDGVLLAGGCAALTGLPEAVARQTAFACQLADPFAGMDRVGTAPAQRPNGDAPGYLTACGLAMRRFLP